MGIVSEEAIDEFQELMDQGLTFSSYLFLCFYFEISNQLITESGKFVLVEEPLKKTYEVCSCFYVRAVLGNGSKPIQLSRSHKVLIFKFRL